MPTQSLFQTLPESDNYSNNDDGNDSNKTNLSIGGILGIVIACLVVGEIIAGVVVFLMTRKKYRLFQKSEILEIENSSYFDKNNKKTIAHYRVYRMPSKM